MLELAITTAVKLSIDEVRAFAETLTVGSLMHEATLQVVAEYEAQVRCAENRHQTRIHRWKRTYANRGSGQLD